MAMVNIVSLTSKFCAKIISKKSSNVVELGCGAGANIPFFLSNKCQYIGIIKVTYNKFFKKI